MQALQYRAALPIDAVECIDLRGRTRQNAVSAERLTALGITVASWTQDIETGRLPGYVCVAEGRIVGYCFGNQESGEIMVLALLPPFENRGIGKELLSLVVTQLQAQGHKRLFLGCARDPSTRSHGFYRHLGWRPTGRLDTHNDEELELVLKHGAASEA